MSDPLSMLASIKGLMPKSAWAALLATSLLLFAPVALLTSLGMAPLVAELRPFIGVIWVIALASALVQVGNLFFQRLQKWEKAKQFPRHLKHQFILLSQDEKEILRQYLDQKSSTLKFPLNHQIIGSLKAKQIVFRSSNLGSAYGLWPFTIQPEALKILKGNPSLLD